MRLRHLCLPILLLLLAAVSSPIMAKECKNLPEECWELVFNRLPANCYSNPLSLVCKQFLFITNRLRFKLCATDQEILIDGNISKLLNRFPHLKSIDFSGLDRNTDIALLGKAISCLLDLEEIDISNKSKLPIWGLKKLGFNTRSLRVFKCNNIEVLSDTDLVAIANSLPLLEELDISNPRNIDLKKGGATVTDAGIKVVSMNLKRLRRINVSGHRVITGESFVCLSMNCRYLEGIEAMDCRSIKPNGLLSLLRNSVNLSSISASDINFHETRSVFEDPVSYGRCLERLEIYNSLISDEFLYLLAKANFPLRRLSLLWCRIITFSALSSLLCCCQSLQYLELGPLDFLTDESIRDLSPYLRNLVAVKFNGAVNCDGDSNLTISTFYILVKSCPLLEHFEMQRTDLGKETTSIVDSAKYMNIRSLNLALNDYLNDECLGRFALICPNLENVDVSLCPSITEEGIANILDMCPEIKSLKFHYCSEIKTIREGSELPNLVELHVECSAIDDRALATIGRRCFGLLKLNVTCCDGVTTRGVEQVLRQCKSLTEINLSSCMNVELDDIVDWTVFSSPSLKKVVLPWSYLTAEAQKRHFLRHGCRVCGD